MGGWKVEVFKMMIYMAFPVGTFYMFHQPQYYEDWVIKVKREMFPPANDNMKKELETIAKKIKERKDAELLNRLEIAKSR